MELLFYIIIAIVVLAIVTLPVRMAAAAMGAKRTGIFWSLLALVGSSILHAVGLSVPCIGSIIAFFLSALAFSVFLGTGFLGGIGIEILTIIFSAIIVLILTALFGISLAEILPFLMDATRPISF